MKSPTKPKCCKCHTDLAASLKNTTTHKATNSIDSDGDQRSKKKTTENEKVHFYDVFGTFDANFVPYLQHFDPPNANYRRYL